MMPRRPQASPRLLGITALLGLVLSQPGHALGYFAQYGPQSFGIQSQGAHAYFPTTINLSVGLLTTLVLAAAVVVGLGRLAVGKALGFRRGRVPSPVAIVLVLAIVQLNVFAFQEMVEAQAAGEVLDGQWLLTWLYLAAAGQLPVAIVAGLLIAWGSVRLEAAIGALRSSWKLLRLSPRPAVVAPGAPSRPIRPSALAETFPAALTKRGPPSHLSLIAI